MWHAVTPDGAGYWLVASDGGIFCYGDAQFYGSTGKLAEQADGGDSHPLTARATAVACDGGIFNFRDAVFLGSAGSLCSTSRWSAWRCRSTGGYYLVASDGGIFSFPTGPAGPPFFGSTGSIMLNKPIVGMAAVQGGYYLCGSDGGIFPIRGGRAAFLGSTGSIALNTPIVGVAS